jgi:hypothetical protein
MWSTVSPWAIRVVGFLYAFFAILSVPVLAYWSLAVPSALREPSSEALTFLAIFTMVLTIGLAAGVASWGLLALRPWARVVALGVNALGAAPILFGVFSDPRVMLRELVLPGAVLLCLLGVSALLLRADFDALRRADYAKTTG